MDWLCGIDVYACSSAYMSQAETFHTRKVSMPRHVVEFVVNWKTGSIWLSNKKKTVKTNSWKLLKLLKKIKYRLQLFV